MIIDDTMTPGQIAFMEAVELKGYSHYSHRWEYLTDCEQEIWEESQTAEQIRRERETERDV